MIGLKIPKIFGKPPPRVYWSPIPLMCIKNYLGSKTFSCLSANLISLKQLVVASEEKKLQFFQSCHENHEKKYRERENTFIFFEKRLKTKKTQEAKYSVPNVVKFKSLPSSSMHEYMKQKLFTEKKSSLVGVYTIHCEKKSKYLVAIYHIS